MEIRLLSDQFVWIDILRDVKSFFFTKNLRDKGRFEIQMESDRDFQASYFIPGSIIQIGGNEELSGVIRDYSLADHRGIQRLILRGEDGNGLFKQRIILPSATEDEDGFYGKASHAMQYYIRKNIIRPRNEKRKIKEFLLAPCPDSPFVNWKAKRGANLLEELKKIAEAGNLDFDVVADIHQKKWKCDIRNNHNRTFSSAFPVVFKPEYYNLESSRFQLDTSRLINTTYHLQVEYEDKNVKNEGIHRFEAYYESTKSESKEDEIKQWMNRRREKISFLPEVNDRLFVLGKNYKLGDLVSVYCAHTKRFEDMRISQMTKAWDINGKQKTEIAFGDEIPDLKNIFIP